MRGREHRWMPLHREEQPPSLSGIGFELLQYLRHRNKSTNFELEERSTEYKQLDQSRVYSCYPYKKDHSSQLNQTLHKCEDVDSNKVNSKLRQTLVAIAKHVLQCMRILFLLSLSFISPVTFV